MFIACEYLRYNQTNNDCELYESSDKECDIYIGPQQPPYEECRIQTTSSPSTTSSITPSSSTTASSSSTILYTTSTPTTGTWKVFTVGGHGGGLNDAQKIDPVKDDTNCIKPPDYPVGIGGPIAEMVSDQSIICCEDLTLLTLLSTKINVTIMIKNHPFGIHLEDLEE